MKISRRLVLIQKHLNEQLEVTYYFNGEKKSEKGCLFYPGEKSFCIGSAEHYHRIEWDEKNGRENCYVDSIRRISDREIIYRK